MKRWLIVLLALGGCGRSGEAPGAPASPVTVFAASSLKEVASEIAAEWSKRSGRPHRLQCEASSTLARQIKEGAPADVFLSAAPEWLDEVGALERFDWLSNRLVLVARKESGTVDLKQLESLSLANEQVPAGKYAKAALAHLGVPLPPRTIHGANVRDVLAKVSEGGCQAGIVYATDAAVDPAVKIVHDFPPGSHAKIVYSVARLTAAGKELFEALREPASIETAKRHGFTALP